jgi:hypothetical protein
MKRIFTVITTLTTVALLHGFTATAFAQSAVLATNFLNQAQSASDAKLGTIAGELTSKVQSLSALLGTNSAVQGVLDSTLKSLTGGQDSEALTSAFKLAEAAKLTPKQIGLAKQVGNLASAYVVEKNFATLDGAQGDVATIVTSLRDGKVSAAIPALKNVATNNSLTDGQKQLIKTVADKYAPGWEKAKGAVDAIRNLPGF